ncbi:hypothetical protein GCM10027613_46730 [Microlunatus endophyticus]
MHRILVTGGTGFVGGYAVLRLLDDGYEVRTTVRNLSRADELRHLLAGHGAAIGRLEIVSADLTKDDGWPAAAAGCQAVLHVASPFPSVAPDDPEQLVRPARDGAIRVLAAARDAGVDRVVLTSSFAAVGYSPTTNGGSIPSKTGPTRRASLPILRRKRSPSERHGTSSPPTEARTWR